MSSVDHYALDLDGVISDFVGAVRLEMGMPHAPDPLTFHEWGWDLPDGREPYRIKEVASAALYRTNLHPELWTTKYTMGILEFLADKDVTIVTARSAIDCLYTAEFVAEYVPHLHGVFCNAHGDQKAERMASLGCTHIIDDCEDNLFAAERVGLIGVAVPWAWNRGWTGEDWTGPVEEPARVHG